jgi:uncharacterized protein YecT (DUF1311 family)/YHS domain-containing protein
LDHQEKQIDRANNDLNRVYQKILAILQNQIDAGDGGDKETKDYLVAAERKWIQWRDAEALSEAYAGGGAAGMSAWREDYHESLLKLIDQRKESLERYLKTSSRGTTPGLIRSGLASINGLPIREPERACFRLERQNSPRQRRNFLESTSWPNQSVANILLAFGCAPKIDSDIRPIMKTHPISILSAFIPAIAVPILVNGASLSRSLLADPTEIAKDKGMVIMPETAKAGMNVDTNGIFLNGYDPVAYFSVHKAIKGNPSIKSSFKGAIIHFASAADKVAFDKNPSKYYPQYGGFCANHLRKGEMVATDPTVFFVYKGKLYLCADAGGAKEFRSNIDANIRNADEQWVTHFGFHGNPPLR